MLLILREKQKRVQKKKDSVLQFKAFLDEVQQKSEEYSDIREILTRYATLITSQTELQTTA